MDVITNALEGVRQYFQGLPAASGPSASPNFQQNASSEQQKNHERPAAVPYWPPHHEPQAPHHETRPPTRESIPQRPPSHHSDSNSRPSHEAKSNYYTGYEGAGQYQFQVPQSREAPTAVNTQHYQQSHILPNPSYQQRPMSIVSSVGYHQTQPVQSQAQYYQSQNRSYYTPVSSKPATNIPYKTAVTSQANQYGDEYKYAQGNATYNQVKENNQIKTTHNNLPPVIGMNYPGYRNKTIRNKTSSGSTTIATTTTTTTTTTNKSYPIQRSSNPTTNNVDSFRTPGLQYANISYPNHPTSYYTPISYSSSNHSHQPNHNQLNHNQTNHNQLNHNQPNQNQVNHNQPNHNQLNHNQSSNNNQSVQKSDLYCQISTSVPSMVDSVLDLSLKTIKTPADSTLDDTDDRNQKFYQMRAANQTNRFETRPNVRPLHTEVVSAPKVDFTPNFNRPMNHNYSNDRRTYQHHQQHQSSHQAAQLQSSQLQQHQTSQLQSSQHQPAHHQALHQSQQSQSQQPQPQQPHVIKYPNGSQSNPYLQNVPKSLPRVDFPSSQIQKSAFAQDGRKRSAEGIPASVLQSKKAKPDEFEAWRQKIDMQIEQKFYAHQAKSSEGQPKLQQSSKSVVNGNYAQSTYQNSQYPVQYTSSGQYHHQTYVPSAAAHHYPSHIPQQHVYQHNLHRSNSQSSLNRVPTSNAGADKRVLSILRSNLEMKGAKEAQRKLDQKILAREVQQPSTDVMAPLQPKTGMLGRQNVSPFTAVSLVERGTPPISYKFPKAIDSVRFEMDVKDDKHDGQYLTNQNDIDGLAANLAARIRTKGELKQMQLQIKGECTPGKEESSTNGTPSTGSPPKLPKEKLLYPPRRRLFNRPEDELNERRSKIPPRDPTGLRSSSETSVFDFPDSDSETEMPVLERQSLEAMRRDRKSISKVSENDDAKDRPFSPTDDIFDKACDHFMEQLKTGGGKKRGRRKKLEPDVLAKLETVTKESSLTSDSTDLKIETSNNNNNNNNNMEETKIKVEKEEEGTDFDEPLIKLRKLEEAKQLTPKIEDQNNKTAQESNLVQNVPKMEIISSFRREIELLKREIESIPRSVQKTEVPKKESLKRLPTIKMEVPSDSSDSENDNAKHSEDKERKKMREQIKKSRDLFALKIQPSNLAKPPKKPTFGDGTGFYPGWEEELYNYKKSLRMPANLISVTRPPNIQRLSTSLPDLDPCPSPTPSSITDNTEFKFKTKKVDSYDSDIDSNSSFNFSMTKNYDSEEGSSSVKSLNIKSKDSILDKLLERYSVGKRRKRLKKKEDQLPKIIPKPENALELLPTPSLEIESITEKKKSGTIIKTESVLFGFRKKTVDSFKDTFINSSTLVSVNEQFTPVVLKSRTRKETRVLKQKATIREVFGEDRPASAPPVTCVDELKDLKRVEDIKQEKKEKTTKQITNEAIKNKLLSKGKNVQEFLKDLIKTEADEQKQDMDAKSETPSLDGDDTPIGRKRIKLRNMRRKGSSGFDYIRKKKKQVKKEENEIGGKQKRNVSKANPESVQDIQKEIKIWVLNKGIGETHLHRSARLGYTDITAYCLEKMECAPSPKDNAGYTPLHEACSRGHLNTAKLLLQYGANVSESAQGGIRPLHEAIENGYVEIVRLLLSYGADPFLATYSGITPLSLATEEQTKGLLENHLKEIQGQSSDCWYFNGPSSCFDPEDSGYDPLENPPETIEPVSEEDEDFDFEVSEVLLPNLYILSGEPSTDRWVLVQDLSSLLKIKSRDALLKQINPPGVGAGNKSVLRELKLPEFLEQARCCQFLNAGEKVNPRASKIALVKYTDKVKELLNVEKLTVPAR